MDHTPLALPRKSKKLLLSHSHHYDCALALASEDLDDIVSSIPCAYCPFTRAAAFKTSNNAFTTLVLDTSKLFAHLHTMAFSSLFVHVDTG